MRSHAQRPRRAALARVAAARLPIARLSIARLAVAGGMALLAAAGCTEDEGPTGPSPIDRRSNEVILHWSEVAFDALTAHDGYGNPMVATRVYAMMHAAQHDAINAVDPVYESYAFHGRDAGADPVAAAAAAAHGVLAELFPAQRATLDAALAEALGTVPHGAAESAGVALGAQAAAAVVALRRNDGSDTPAVGDYVPGTGPGRYQFTPPFPLAHTPGWRHVRPFALVSPEQFRVAPPPALTSAAYTAAFDEVKRLGQLGGTARTADQAAYARFWYEFSEIGWNRIARTIAAERELGLQSTARLFALLNMAMADGYIAGWDSKFHHDFWRPYTAIRAADTDGNPATAADPAWEPAEPTPPVQDHPSTHSVLGDAAAEVLASVFGDAVGFTFTSTTAAPAGSTRSFTSLSQAADENADSRVMAGIHFRFAADAGQALGRKVGAWTVAHHLRAR
jgi:hypothetical protein